jgi:hypothetical protein
MILLKEVSGGAFAAGHPLAYALACLAATVAIAFAYPRWQVRMR